MKKGFILLGLAFLSATSIFAQRATLSRKIPARSPITKEISSEVTGNAEFRERRFPRLPKGLRVNVKLASLDNLVIQEASPADMFVFRVYETTLLPQTNDPNSFNFQTCRLTEVFGFQVVGQSSLTMTGNGEKTFNFSLTGLREGVSYGVDVFPMNNRVAAAPSYELNKSGITSSVFCNSLSAVGGTPIAVQFYPNLPPR